MRWWFAPVWVVLTWLTFTACTNNPYPSADSHQKITYEAYETPPKTLDPAIAYSTTDHVVTGRIFDTLLEYHYLKRPYELIPGQAKAVPKVQQLDGSRMMYRFELLPELFFQDDDCFADSAERVDLDEDGVFTRPLLAQDYAFGLTRLADPAVNSPAFQSFILVEGFAEFRETLKKRREDPQFAKLPDHEQYRQLGGIRGIVTPDDHTLEVVLSEPYPQLLYWFTMPFTAPMPWEAVQMYDGNDGRPHLADHPVGNGTYFLSLYEKHARIVLDKNPNWYGIRHPEWHAPGAIYPTEGNADEEPELLAAAGQPLPFIDRVDMRRDKESIPRFGKFLQGYYDASTIIAESFDMVIQGDALTPEMQEMGIALEKSVRADIWYLGFNMEDPVVGAPGGERARKLRQAMSLVIDIKEFLRVFLNGRGVPAQSLLPPALFGHDPDYKNPYRELDVERAKRLLAEAGYEGGIDPKTGKPLRLSFNTGNTSPTLLLRYEFFRRAWRQIGLDVVIDATNYNQFQDKMRRGAFQIYMWGWVADYPDPENFLFLLWSESIPRPNSSRFSNKEFDDLFVQMKSRDNDDERYQQIRKLISIVEYERPWIELFYSEQYALYHSWFHNVKPAGLSLLLTKYRRVDPVARAERREEMNRPILWPLFAMLALFAAVFTPGVITFFRERQ